MLGAFYRSKNDLAVLEVDEPQISGLGQAVVRVRACGVCGTDLKMLHGEYEGTAPPVILGHEFSGEVAAVSGDVVGVLPGDHVVADPNLNCGTCYHCRRSEENLCTSMVTTGMNRNGGMAEYCLVPASTLHVVPASLPFDEAAFAEPLACVLNGVKRAGVRPGDSVGIVGLGPIGVLFSRALARSGASQVIGFEVSPERTALARGLGVSEVIDPRYPGWMGSVLKSTGGVGVDVAIDAVGSTTSTRTALDSVRRGGRVVVFGIPSPGSRIDLDAVRLVASELELRGSFIDRFTFPSAIRMLSTRTIDVRPLVTHRFGLAQAPEAFEGVARGSGLKTQIVP